MNAHEKKKLEARTWYQVLDTLANLAADAGPVYCGCDPKRLQELQKEWSKVLRELEK